MAKVGDIVRFLNSVGGGRITRIADRMAYVEDADGFETPVLLRECVVVGEASSPTASVFGSAPKAAPEPVPQPVSVAAPAHIDGEVEDEIDIEETSTGDTINLQLLFEPKDLKSMSTSTFDTYLINDSNYYLYFTYLCRERGADRWTTRYSGMVEPNIQLFVEELAREELPGMDYIAVGVLPFKKGREFAPPAPMLVERRMDTTKFSKLHCFTPGEYSDTPVLSVPVIVDGTPYAEAAAPVKKSDAKVLERQMKSKIRADRRRQPRNLKNAPTTRRGDVIVVDLHINELLDNTRGLGAADILNYQIDTFRKVMDDNARNKGQKIVFIHGKGEGVLRKALLKELTHRYKGNDVQDASFAEYGYGATQVTIG